MSFNQPMNEAVGVYCLANDAVLEWFIAFVKSFRQHHQTLRLIVIPFDDECAEIKKLSSLYDFSIVDDVVSLQTLDEVGTSLYPRNRTAIHAFRKFLVFWGELDLFWFLDADVVVLDDLSSLLWAFKRSGADVLCTDYDVDQVYEAGWLKERSLSDPGFLPLNTGTFMGRRGILSLHQVQNLARSSDLTQLRSGTLEQPFLNYCLHEAGARIEKASEFAPKLYPSAWAANEGVARCHNVVALTRRGIPNDQWVPLLHWAGIKLTAQMPLRECYLRYRLSGTSVLYKALYLTKNSIFVAGVHRSFQRVQRRMLHALRSPRLPDRA